MQQELPTHGTAPAKTEKAGRTTGRENKHFVNPLERHLVVGQIKGGQVVGGGNGGGWASAAATPNSRDGTNKAGESGQDDGT